ncbi:aspartate 1-decarboxylase [Candidatus Poribacteria bacterium]|nr:aspartate 1-decarboxylase [Candidatus Poribacteria bacterium]
MNRILLKSKIHRATVTEANLDYIGSITICRDLMDKADLWEWEKVLVVDLNNGSRLETYVIPGENGTICMNGAAAHKIFKGDRVIIMGFAITREPIKPKLVLVNDKNEFVRFM